MTTRAHLDNQIGQLAARGVIVIEDADEKTVRFEMDARTFATISDKKLYSLMQAAAKVETAFITMGYTSQGGPT